MSKSMVARLLALVVVLAGLAACVTPEQLRAQDEADCRGFGFQPNTPEFATCLQRQSLARRYYAPPPPPAWYGPAWVGPGYYVPPPGVVW